MRSKYSCVECYANLLIIPLTAVDTVTSLAYCTIQVLHACVSATFMNEFQTLHVQHVKVIFSASSLLKLPIGSRGNKDLTGQSLCRLQENLNDIDYIIDEYCILGQVAFGRVGKCCKQIGCKDKALIFSSAPGQLPPVAKVSQLLRIGSYC